MTNPLRTRTIGLFLAMCPAASPLIALRPAEHPSQTPPSANNRQQNQPATVDLRMPYGRHTDDLDEMVKRKNIRALVMINPIGFFYSGGQPMGVNYETLRDFESFASKKLKTGTIKVKVTFIPVRPEELEAALTEGKGDVGAHALVITPERQERVAFTTPLEKGVKQVIVSGANFVQVSGFQESAAPVGSTVGKSWTNSRRNLTIRNTWNVIRGSVAPTTPPAAKDADRFSLVDRRAKTYAQARGRSVVAARESGRWSVVPVSVERAIPIQLAPKLYVVRRIQKN